MLRATPGTTWTRGRRGALIGASAAVVCLGATLAACGGDQREGYTATGAVGGPLVSGSAVPTGGVTLVPLERPGATTGGSGAPAPAKGDRGSGAGSGDPAGSTPAAGDRGTPSSAPAAGTSGAQVGGAESGRTAPTSPPATATPAPTAPVGPAALSWGEPVRTATDRRWCEDVELTFVNSGGTAVRSGTVTFGTHIIGLLGIDWGTVESAERLPLPIGAGARKEKTWTVCVDAWRVPLGMHVETRDVTVQWK
ncbi:hypothetical protein [Streptomyces gilvus]|uniref:hypothetical protein n=1 Tax=Streptomyces gilvus TaxID=2920937 RepID=UPI001F0E341A|nr:hypothetical protein [Streptomyces sp. CME 23]MCH5677671.1 hypothetical protein [Streptomyces sp. CME 23]